MKYQLAQYSLTGARPANEDRVGAAERANAVLMVVADGLGGHSGGELAAQTLVDTVLRVFQRITQRVIEDPAAFLALTILQAHKAVAARGKMHVPPLAARTTCVLCLVQNGYAYWGHVGDSRLYHFRKEKLLARTEDHTAIEQLRRDGLISEAEMSTHPRKSYLMQSVGGGNAPTIALGPETRLFPGDTLLLCSDGVWEAYTAEQLGANLSRARVDEALEDMLLAAEKNMGEACDNVSAVCLRWEDRVTTSMPLQGDGAQDVGRLDLWKSAASKTVARTLPAGDAPADDNASIERRIRELEEYLQRFERK